MLVVSIRQAERWRIPEPFQGLTKRMRFCLLCFEFKQAWKGYGCQHPKNNHDNQEFNEREAIFLLPLFGITKLVQQGSLRESIHRFGDDLTTPIVTQPEGLD